MSDRVTPEVILSDECNLLPLEDGADVWAHAIWEQFIEGSRGSAAGEAFECFDIEKAAKKLGAFYMRLAEEAQR